MHKRALLQPHSERFWTCWQLSWLSHHDVTQMPNADHQHLLQSTSPLLFSIPINHAAVKEGKCMSLTGLSGPDIRWYHQPLCKDHQALKSAHSHKPCRPVLAVNTVTVTSSDRSYINDPKLWTCDYQSPADFSKKRIKPQLLRLMEDYSDISISNLSTSAAT